MRLRLIGWSLLAVLCLFPICASKAEVADPNGDVVPIAPPLHEAEPNSEKIDPDSTNAINGNKGQNADADRPEDGTKPPSNETKADRFKRLVGNCTKARPNYETSAPERKPELSDFLGNHR